MARLLSMVDQSATKVKSEPVALLIIDESGITIFSCKFVNFTNIDDQLIGGFLTAVNAFGNEIFKGSGSLDVIMYQKFSVSMKTIENLTFCYICNGTPDLNLLEMLAFQIRYNSDLWDHLEFAIKHRLSIMQEYKMLINEYASEIFDHNSIF